jgi:hypothetical protein
LIKGLRNERPGHSTICTTTSGWSNRGRREQVKPTTHQLFAKKTSLLAAAHRDRFSKMTVV